MRSFVSETLATRVVFGAGSVDRVGDETGALGLRHVLVVASRSNADASVRAEALLAERFAALVDEVREHVPESLAAAAVETAKTAGADGLLTIGGGSAIGLGKAVARELGLPLVAVPTTYSGSEMTAIYGVTGARKRTGRDPRAAPAVVVYDPELTVSLPPGVTASSGFNALAHAVEALYAPGTNPVAGLLAEEAVRVLARALPDVVSTPHDLEARTRAQYGGHLAGVVLAQAGVALQHRLSHVLGGGYGLGHAEVHAVLLPHVAAYNEPAVPDDLARVAAALGADDAPAGLHRLAGRIGAPTSLEDLGMPEASLDEAAAAAADAVGDANPRPADASSLRTLLADAYAGHHPRNWNQGATP